MQRRIATHSITCKHLANKFLSKCSTGGIFILSFTKFIFNLNDKKDSSHGRYTGLTFLPRCVQSCSRQGVVRRSKHLASRFPAFCKFTLYLWSDHATKPSDSVPIRSLSSRLRHGRLAMSSCCLLMHLMRRNSLLHRRSDQK